MTVALELTDAWTQIGSGASDCVIQFSGDGEVYIGSSAPAATDVGFRIRSGDPVELPAVSALGGGVWVRSLSDSGTVIHATA